MTSELTALAALMADFFRDRAVPLVIAAQAGLDTALIPGSDTIADLWWNVIERAYAEGRLRELVDVAKSRVGARGSVLEQAYQKVMDAEPTSEAAQPPAQTKRRRPPRGQDGAHLSDYRADERRDARIDQMQRDMADMREKIAGLVVQVTNLTELVKSQGRQNRSSLTDGQFAAVLVSFIIIALVVFAVVYYGGNQ